jgi:hypothetical protein
MAVLHPLECYLLERFSSPDHFALTRDAIAAWIDAHEAAYLRISTQIDPRQRGGELWRQGDVIWGSRVLPNIRPQKDAYVTAYFRRVDGDPRAFSAGGSMAYNNRGICEFWDGWMTDEETRDIARLGQYATELDFRLATTGRGWREGSLTYLGQGDIYHCSELPSRIPRYELDQTVRIERDEKTTQVGIYLPDVEHAPARLLFPTQFEGGTEVYQGLSRSQYVSPTGRRSYCWKDEDWTETGWTLIRRVENEFIEVPPGGFFPKGHPDELYTWPEREHLYIQREKPHITGMSGEPSPHFGLWSLFRLSHPEGHCSLKKGERLPAWEGKTVEWIMVRRLDAENRIDE